MRQPPFDLGRVAISLLPTVLRRPVAAAILRSATSALQGAHDRIREAHQGEPRGTYYVLRHTGQVESLQSLLNDRHDPRLRRIRIGEGDGRERWYIYNANDLAAQPYLLTYLPDDQEPTWLYPDADYASVVSSGEFVVNAPADIRSAEASLRASIDLMRAAGTQYTISYF